MVRRIGILGISIPLLLIGTLLAACGGSSSSSSSSGPTGSVQGNLASFTAFHDGIIPETPGDGDYTRGFALFGLPLAAYAQAGGVANVSVTVAGISTQTNASGNFRVNGVPAGQRIVTFSGGGVTGTTTINVAAGGTTTLVNVVVDNGRARATRVTVTGGGSRSDDSSDDFSDDDSTDDDSTDDDSTDDDSTDDDSTDDDSTDDDTSDDASDDD